jgi:hypothetical protein
MADADLDPLPARPVDEPRALFRGGAHRLFEQDMPAGVHDRLRRPAMVLGREEHVDRVEPWPFEHRFERLVDPADAVSLREQMGAGRVLVADRGERRARHRAERLGVPVGDVAGAEEPDHQLAIVILHHRE